MFTTRHVSEMQLFALQCWILARERDKELHAVNPSDSVKMFVAWNVMGKFKDVSIRGVVFLAVVSDGPSPSQMEILFMWVFTYRGWKDKIVYTWALKVACWRQND